MGAFYIDRRSDKMSLSNEALYIVQLIVIIVAGGFIGEFYRTSN